MTKPSCLLRITGQWDAPDSHVRFAQKLVYDMPGKLVQVEIAHRFYSIRTLKRWGGWWDYCGYNRITREGWMRINNVRTPKRQEWEI